MSQPDTYTPGQSYTLTTIQDVILLYGRLPEDRAELMLKEIGVGIRVSAPSMKMVQMIIETMDKGARVEPQSFTWIDDDKGEGEVRFKDPSTGEDMVSFKVHPEGAAD